MSNILLKNIILKNDAGNIVGSGPVSIEDRGVEMSELANKTLNDIAGAGVASPASAPSGAELITHSYLTQTYDATIKDWVKEYTSAGTGGTPIDPSNLTTDQVKLSQPIIVSDDIGAYKAKQEIAAGTTLTQILNGILCKVLRPTVINPTIVFSTDYMLQEDVIGTPIVLPSLSFILGKGSYSYGPSDTEVSYTNGYWQVNNGTATNLPISDLSNYKGTIAAQTTKSTYSITEDHTYVVKLTATHSAGILAYNNIGQIAEPNEQILANTISGTATFVYRGYCPVYLIKDGGPETLFKPNGSNTFWIGPESGASQFSFTILYPATHSLSVAYDYNDKGDYVVVPSDFITTSIFTKTINGIDVTYNEYTYSTKEGYDLPKTRFQFTVTKI